ncbi:hypothetical protein NW762_013020 [Fusarium torreyae]|uniref:Nephrocystin 3-like N-terminal domain-containing protein n=1 Tax=Fusarium torreyae TaxID=1237075 RepID=A0A9W8RMX5_9HYPO|nr:hypothetical protein NW762_013020 [Fusarium torreyae]
MSDPQKYTVGWICAITTEFVAARALFDEKHDQLEAIADDDNNNYALGRIGKHNVVMAVLPKSEYGTTSAAVVANNMLRTFPNIRFGLMVGIGGGAPSAKHDIRLGDVVVSTRSNGEGGVFQYDYGKTIQSHAFVTTGFLNQPPQLLLAAISGLEAEYELEGHHLGTHVDKALDQWPRLRKKYSRPLRESDRLYRPDVLHPSSTDGYDDTYDNDPAHLVIRSDRDDEEDDPVIHYGLIASANQLMKDALIRDELAASKDVLCFEMEAAGLMNHFPCVVIRGICDYSDSHKNKDWQGFAAMMAAAYAKDLLRQIPPGKVEAELPIREVLSSIERTGDETKHIVMSMESKQHLAKIEDWLSPPDYSTNTNLARAQRHPGTGSWMLDSVPFQEWKLGSRQNLWLYGLAGCGKTILSTTILDHVLSLGAHPTLAFYFDFNDPKKQTLEGLLRSLALQLYRTDEQAARRLDDIFVVHNNGMRQPDTATLSSYISSTVQASGDLIIVLDALDECTMKRELVFWIEGLVSSKVQFIVTGRPEADFKSALPRLFDKRNCILLDNRAVDADIRSYVMATLVQRPDFVEKKLPLGLLNEIRDKIGNGADGMFRWAACQLESLARCLSPKDIKIALNSLPRDLNDTYYRMIQNIPQDYKYAAIRLLQFLVHTKRPLELSEAIEVIATQPEKEPQGFDIDSRLCRQHDVLRYCPGLVTIAEIAGPDESLEELHLAHFSVKEYLLKQDQFDLQGASSVITGTCLAYLEGIDGDYITIKSKFPMSKYAADYWMQYAVLMETSDARTQAMVSFLRNKTTFTRWTQLYERYTTPPRGSVVYHACLGGLTEVVKSLTVDTDDMNMQGGRFGNALQAASFRGHLAIVQLLLDSGVNVNQQGGYFDNALQAAASRGHLETVQLLMDAGANVNQQGGSFDNALQAAASEGHLETVQQLLDNGANLDMLGEKFGTALIAACQTKKTEVVRLLLDRGADINAQGGLTDGSALQAVAARRDNLSTVKLLLSRGADINARGGIYGNALQIAAARRDNLATVKLLLSEGADINAQGGVYGNALQAAAAQRDNLAMVQFLINEGADVNAQGGRFQNAFRAATHAGDYKAVQLLRDKGANTDT